MIKAQKQDYAQAEVMYQRAVKADPNHANNLGNCANFLYQQKQDYAQAEVMYQRAVEADPNHANHLGNYAIFLNNQKQDYAQAEVMYQRAVEADPNHANHLGNYALFLNNQKQDYAQAEVMYQRAVKAAPNHANHLGNYANFLYQQKQDYAQAEVMYQAVFRLVWARGQARLVTLGPRRGPTAAVETWLDGHCQRTPCGQSGDVASDRGGKPGTTLKCFSLFGRDVPRVAPGLPPLIPPLPTLRRARPAAGPGRLRRNNNWLSDCSDTNGLAAYPHQTEQTHVPTGGGSRPQPCP